MIKILGGLYAGATAGGNVKASAGLAGGVAGDKTAGNGFASAQAGPHYAASGLVGDIASAQRRKEARWRRKQLKVKRLQENSNGVGY